MKSKLGTALQAVLALVIWFGAQAIADAIDRHTDERVAYRTWVSDACTPGTGETAIAKRDGGQLHCAIYTRAERGFAPQLVSVSVMDLPQ